MENLKYTRADN